MCQKWFIEYLANTELLHKKFVEEKNNKQRPGRRWGSGLVMKASMAHRPEVCRNLTADPTEAESLFYFLLCSVLTEPWGLAQMKLP